MIEVDARSLYPVEISRADNFKSVARKMGEQALGVLGLATIAFFDKLAPPLIDKPTEKPRIEE